MAAEAELPAESPRPSTADQGQDRCSKASSLRTSSSTGRLEVRKSYGGTYVNGRFIPTKAKTVDDMTEAERQQILADLAASREAKMQELEERTRTRRQLERQREQARQDRFSAEQDEAKSWEEERRQKKALELNKWLKKKDDELRAQKERDTAMLAEFREKERQKQEQQALAEQRWLAERERRLALGQKKKERMAAELQAMRATHTGGFEGGPGMEASGYDEPTLRPASRGGRGAGQRAAAQRFAHAARHPDDEEMGAESRLRATQGGYQGGGYPARPATAGSRPRSHSDPSLYPGAPPDGQHGQHGPLGKHGTPTWRYRQMARRPPPLGGLPAEHPGDPDEVLTARTQEALNPRGANLPAYSRGLAMAGGAYADSGRPRHLRPRSSCGYR